MVRFSKKKRTKKRKGRNDARPNPSTPVHLGKRTPLTKKTGTFLEKINQNGA